MEGDEVFLTGATGFIGRHVRDALLTAGYRVRALVRPTSRPLPSLPGLQQAPGDLLRPGELAHHMAGCRYLVHVAALYAFAPRQRRDIWATNVHGCAAVLEAARIAGVERAVVTSSSATVGPARGERPADEGDWAPEEADGVSAYHHSKIEQERVALAARVPTVLVLPTTPIGPGDWKPTPTGKMVVDFMRGRMFASLGGGLNVAPVEDVARAHVLALRLGQPRARYLVGGENLSLAELWRRLAVICGRKAPTPHVPYTLALTLGWADELRCRVTPGVATPVAPLEGVRMARHNMFVRCERAKTELGYAPTPVTDALERAVRWYRDNGYA